MPLIGCEALQKATTNDNARNSLANCHSVGVLLESPSWAYISPKNTKKMSLYCITTIIKGLSHIIIQFPPLHPLPAAFKSGHPPCVGMLSLIPSCIVIVMRVHHADEIFHGGPARFLVGLMDWAVSRERHQGKWNSQATSSNARSS